MSKREIRPRGNRGVFYASCRWEGFLLQDCLETTDEQLERIRLAELKHQVDRGNRTFFLIKSFLKINIG